MNLSNAVVFCSCQPCPRPAEGDLEITVGEKTIKVAICPRHYEYVANKIEQNPDILSREILFIDDLDSAVIDAVQRLGRPFDIVES